MPDCSIVTLGARDMVAILHMDHDICEGVMQPNTCYALDESVNVAPFDRQGEKPHLPEMEDWHGIRQEADEV